MGISVVRTGGIVVAQSRARSRGRIADRVGGVWSTARSLSARRAHEESEPERSDGGNAVRIRDRTLFVAGDIATVDVVRGGGNGGYVCGGVWGQWGYQEKLLTAKDAKNAKETEP